MSLKNFIKELKGNRVEGELLKTIFYSLLTSFATLGLLYLIMPDIIESSIPKYGFFIFFAAIGIALILPSIRQVRAHKQFSCMSGMMIGMTDGMVAGFLLGYIIGATNGMFIGGVFGMVIGSVLGIWMGSCCGVMGFMEGIMAGFMGGLMGAMTSVMLLNDNLKLATIIIVIFLGIISFSLNYMIFLETKDRDRQLKESQKSVIVITFILMILTLLVMFFGPRSALGI